MTSTAPAPNTTKDLVLHASPDLRHLRRIATDARDGHTSLGIRHPPTTHVLVHHEHLLVLLDAVNPPTVELATTIDQIQAAAGDLNQAIATNHGVRDAVRRIAHLAQKAKEQLTR